MRIGILTHNYPKIKGERKDAGIFVYDFAQQLAKKNKVFVFCPDFAGEKEVYKKVPVNWFSWGRPNKKFGNWSFFSPLSVYYFFKLLIVGEKKAIAFAQENRLDYCLAAWSLPSAIFAYVIKKRLGIRYGVWNLGSDLNKYVKFPILRQLIVLSLNHADNLFANSYDLCNKVKKLTGRKCTFLQSVTDIQKENIDRPVLDENLFNFLYVGRLEKVKGPDILLAACAILKKEKPEFKVNLLGGGSMVGFLSKRVQSQTLGNSVKLHGWADEKKVLGYMKISDCLIVPSRSESLPQVIIEAAKVGLPVIATDVGDCKRLIIKYQAGFWVPKENSAKLAEAMKKAMSEGKLFKKKRSKSLLKMTEGFTQDESVRIFLHSIKEIK
jgi:glycosyltransferase involved in cell wall biosynthesis